MKFLYSFLLLSTLSSILLYGIYLILFRNDRSFLLVRCYLLFSLLSSVFTVTSSERSIRMIFPEMIVPVDSSIQETFIDWLFWGYWGGVLIFFLLFIVKIFRIMVIIRNSEPVKENVFLCKQDYAPFSFWRYIVMRREDYKDEGSEQIILHEKEHIRQLHTLDLLFLEIVKLFHWFNPIVYFYGHSLRSVHEYAADASVLKKGGDPYTYFLLMIKQSTGYATQTIGHSFNQVLTKKRIKMMTTQKKSKGSIGKLVFTLPILAFLLFINCSKDKQHDSEEKLLLKDNTSLISEENEMQISETISLANAEEKPVFPGGDEALYEFLSTNLHYPESALQNNTQGTVVVEFVVEKDGRVSDIKTIQSLSPDCDKEAMRVIQMMPEWNPGKSNNEPVRVFFQMPVRFALD